jgi:type 2 lantibiotic biosynthesis protein LanM
MTVSGSAKIYSYTPVGAVRGQIESLVPVDRDSSQFLMKEVERLLRRAAPLSDTAAVTFVNRDSGSGAGVIAKRLSRWRNNAAENSCDAFTQRLEWEGQLPQSAGSFLGDERPLTPGDDFWAQFARSIVQHLTEHCSAEEDNRYPAPSDIPFAPLFSPLVVLASRELSHAAVLAPDAEVHLRDSLYERLSIVSHRAVGAEFRTFRNALPIRDGAWLAFEEHMRRGGLLGLFERLPVLLRLLATAISLWLEETSEFLGRLAADHEDLGQFFGGGNPGTVEEISYGLSDPHRGGRNVKIVRFASGLRAVYKPRNLETDVAWSGLTEWMGQHTGVVLRSPRVLGRGDWGWVEFIPHEPCESAEGVEWFYRRAGHLLGLLYVTHSSDFHDENMVAFGEFPVPIDFETVFNPENFAMEQQKTATLQFGSSVVRTLMLPNWMEFGDQSDATDLSALGSRPETQPDITRRRWIHPNSDATEFVASQQKRKQRHNAPFLRDAPSPDAGQFVGKIMDGFAETYECLMANRDALLSPNSPLEAFRACRTRLVLRPTRIYVKVAERALSPSCLTCGVDRSLEFEGLSRHFLASRENHGGRAMFRAEVRAMEKLDIPYFQLQTDSRDLLDGEGQVIEKNFIGTPGYEKVRERIAGLSSADRAFQLELIRASFVARDLGGPDQPPVFTAVGGIMKSGRFLEAARGIGRDIESRTIWNGEEANWIGHDTLPVSGRLRVQALGSSLYSGLAGVAVFLAALFAVDAGPQYRRAALGVTRTLRHSLVDSPQDRKTLRTFFLAEGIGGASGASSTIYGLLKVGQILNDDETVDTALCLSRLLDGDAIADDKKLDVMGGAAGAIFSLLALWKHTGAVELAQKAKLCGEHLLRMQGSEGAWLTIAHRPLAGFSHGAAGIGLALLLLHAAAPDARFQQAAKSAFAYERALFSSEACNWEDLRDHVTDRFAMASWCHGAAGVALSRIGALPLVSGGELEGPLRSDLDFGLRYLESTEITNNGTVCCGEMGRADILLHAARSLGRPDLEGLARQRAAGVLAGLQPADERPFIPGFFQGSAGIGYGLLRLIAPDRLPSILLWE